MVKVICLAFLALLSSCSDEAKTPSSDTLKKHNEWLKLPDGMYKWNNRHIYSVDEGETFYKALFNLTFTVYPDGETYFILEMYEEVHDSSDKSDEFEYANGRPITEFGQLSEIYLEDAQGNVLYRMMDVDEWNRRFEGGYKSFSGSVEVTFCNTVPRTGFFDKKGTTIKGKDKAITEAILESTHSVMSRARPRR